MKTVIKLYNYLRAIPAKQYLFVFFGLAIIVLVIILLSKIGNVITNNQITEKNNKVLTTFAIKQDSIIVKLTKQTDTLSKTTQIFSDDRKEILTIIKEDSKIYKTLQDAKEKIPTTVYSLPHSELQLEVAKYNY